MADRCDQCTYFVEDDEYGDYCSLSLDEDEMEKFLTGNTEQCHYFRLYDEYKIAVSYTHLTLPTNSLV